MSDQKICPTCGTEYPLSERFCPRDGAVLRGPPLQDELMGSIVAERYHVLRKLGEGGMGTVYLAEHVKMGRKAALKVMNPGMTSDADAIARFNREAANASRLNHPNVCAIYDFGETPDGLIYLAMEYIEGEPLTALVERSGQLAPARAAAIVGQVAEALSAAHDSGIVHRDLKPDNIMIAKARDGGDLVKVVDFGIAKASAGDSQKVTRTGLVVGTPEYMSPEQLGGEALDGRSDVYSLGLVAFNCLTGTLPFPGTSAQASMIMRLTSVPKSLGEMRPDIAWPAELQGVMAKVLARDAADRYQQATDFGHDMAKAVAGMAAVDADAGTLVMTPADVAVPRTRVSAKSGATTNVDAADAPALRDGTRASKIPRATILAAAVLLAALGGAALFVSKKGAATVPSPPGSTPGGVPTAGSPAAPQAAATAPAASTAKPPGPDTRPANDSGVRLLSKSSGVNGTKSQSTIAPSAATDAAATIAHWDDAINHGTPTAADAARAIGELTPLIPKLSGRDRSNAIYLRMMAYGIAEDDAELCAAVKDVIANDPVSNHVKTAQEAAKARDCK